MTLRRVFPGSLRGSLRAPPSKSYTHRALVAAHLAGRRFDVIGPLDAEDTRATARALTALGSSVRRLRGRWEIRPNRHDRRRRVSIDCGESGTTLRLVAPLAALSGRSVRLTGRGRLPRRPIRELFRALEALGASCDARPNGPSLPADVEGPLHGGPVRVDASQSSQFVSALLMTMPTLPQDSRLTLTGPIVSEPYIEATLSVLRRQRIRCDRRGRTFRIPGGQRYSGGRFVVPGDASSAAYFWVGAAVTGGRVSVRGVPAAWPQADLAVLDLLRRAGAEVRIEGGAITVRGGRRRPFSVDLTRSPDLYPLVGVLAATTAGTCRLTGAAHVVHKESDRRAGTVRIARALGARVRRIAGGLAIEGREHPRAFRLLGLDDHRLVMSAAVGALAASGVSEVADASAVAKSFPEFWTVLDGLRREQNP